MSYQDFRATFAPNGTVEYVSLLSLGLGCWMS